MGMMKKRWIVPAVATRHKEQHLHLLRELSKPVDQLFCHFFHIFFRLNAWPMRSFCIAGISF